jgi:phosphatidylglycerol:prolipoprotein diacylglycerol transferase
VTVIDPIAIAFGPFEVRWYGLLYAAGIATTWFFMRHLARVVRADIGVTHVDAVMFWITLAVVGGGRAGDLLFYRFADFIGDPWAILDIDRGGMSFFGGFLAVAVVLAAYSRSSGVPFLPLADVTAAATPAGLCLGRIGNFLNGELYGPTTSLPWGIVFIPGTEPRHPTPLYEAILEGAALFALLYPAALWGQRLRVPGRTTGLFLCGYAFFRVAMEELRLDYDPLRSAGYRISLAQLLCVPMLLGGVAMVASSARRSRSGMPSAGG